MLYFNKLQFGKFGNDSGHEQNPVFRYKAKNRENKSIII